MEPDNDAVRPAQKRFRRASAFEEGHDSVKAGEHWPAAEDRLGELLGSERRPILG